MSSLLLNSYEVKCQMLLLLTHDKRSGVFLPSNFNVAPCIVKTIATCITLWQWVINIRKCHMVKQLFKWLGEKPNDFLKESQSQA